MMVKNRNPILVIIFSPVSIILTQIELNKLANQ